MGASKFYTCFFTCNITDVKTLKFIPSKLAEFQMKIFQVMMNIRRYAFLLIR